MSFPEVEVLNSLVSKFFKIEDVTTGETKEFIVRYRGYFLTEDTVAAYDQVAEVVRQYKVMPLFRKEADGKQAIFLRHPYRTCRYVPIHARM